MFVMFGYRTSATDKQLATWTMKVGHASKRNPMSVKCRASDFPLQKKQFSVSKTVKFRFASVSLLAKLNSMKSQSKENHEIVIGFPMNLNHHWIKITISAVN